MLGFLYFLGILLLIPIVVLLLISFLFMVPWIGFSVPGIGEGIEKGILERFNDRMNDTIGMSLPPYEAQYNEPTTCMNGSFYGAVLVKFKKPLTDDFLSEFQNRLKIASPKLLWRDGDLITRMVLFQYKDIDEMWLFYGRRHWWEEKEGDFKVKTVKHTLTTSTMRQSNSTMHPSQIGKIK